MKKNNYIDYIDPFSIPPKDDYINNLNNIKKSKHNIIILPHIDNEWFTTGLNNRKKKQNIKIIFNKWKIYKIYLPKYKNSLLYVFIKNKTEYNFSEILYSCYKDFLIGDIFRYKDILSNEKTKKEAIGYEYQLIKLIDKIEKSDTKTVILTYPENKWITDIQKNKNWFKYKLTFINNGVEVLKFSKWDNEESIVYFFTNEKYEEIYEEIYEILFQVTISSKLYKNLCINQLIHSCSILDSSDPHIILIDYYFKFFSLAKEMKNNIVSSSKNDWFSQLIKEVPEWTTKYKQEIENYKILEIALPDGSCELKIFNRKKYMTMSFNELLYYAGYKLPIGQIVKITLLKTNKEWEVTIDYTSYLLKIFKQISKKYNISIFSNTKNLWITDIILSKDWQIEYAPLLIKNKFILYKFQLLDFSDQSIIPDSILYIFVNTKRVIRCSLYELFQLVATENNFYNMASFDQTIIIESIEPPDVFFSLPVKQLDLYLNNDFPTSKLYS